MSSEMKRRVLMTIAGVCICGLSIGMFSFSNLGLDPFQVFAHGTWHLTHMGFGTFYALMNIVLLVLIFFVNRRKIGLGTVINLFGVGYMAEFSEWVIRHFVHTEAFGVRFLFLVLGIVVMCLSSAIYFTADLGVSTYDAVALTIAPLSVSVYPDYDRPCLCGDRLGGSGSDPAVQLSERRICTADSPVVSRRDGRCRDDHHGILHGTSDRAF